MNDNDLLQNKEALVSSLSKCIDELQKELDNTNAKLACLNESWWVRFKKYFHIFLK